MEHSGLKIVQCVNEEGTILVKQGQYYKVDREYLNKAQLKYDLTNIDNGGSIMGVNRSRFKDVSGIKPSILRYNKSVNFPEEDKSMLVNFTVFLNSRRFINKKSVNYRYLWWRKLQSFIIDLQNLKDFLNNKIFYITDIVEYYKNSKGELIRVYYKFKYSAILSIVVAVNKRQEIIEVEVNNYEGYNRLERNNYCQVIKQLEYKPKDTDGFIEVSKKDNKICSKNCQFYLKSWRYCELFKVDLKDTNKGSARCENCLSYVG